MSYTLEEENHDTPDGRFRIRVSYDESPFSPRDDSNLTTIIGWDRHYNLSDDGQPTPRYMFEDYTPVDWWRSYVNLDDENGRTYSDDAHVGGVPVLFAVPLQLADYGANGVHLRLKVDEWDRASGVVFVTEDSWNECMGADHPRPVDSDGWLALIVGEIQTYEDYINGNVYEYAVDKVVTCDRGYTHYENEERVGGFIGEEGIEGALAEARVSVGVVAEVDGSIAAREGAR